MPWYAICKERLVVGTSGTLVGKEYEVKKIGPSTVKIMNVESEWAGVTSPPFLIVNRKAARHAFNKPEWRLT